MKQILILEDIPEARHWLVNIVRETFPGCQISETVTGREGIELADRTAFDLALVDLGLPDASGVDILRQLRARNPETICVVVSAMGEDAYIVSALAAGAAGYLLKEEPPDLLARHLTRLADGVPALSPRVARRIMEHFRLTGPVIATEASLSKREKEVLTLISRGLRNSEVANSLGIAESTVATHIKSIYRKLGISSRAEASWHASRLGL